MLAASARPRSRHKSSPSGPIAARYVYQDVDFGDPAYNGGASATVGLQLDNSNYEQVSYNTPILADGDVD